MRLWLRVLWEVASTLIVIAFWTAVAVALVHGVRR
jgi:hypothetical protein